MVVTQVIHPGASIGSGTSFDPGPSAAREPRGCKGNPYPPGPRLSSSSRQGMAAAEGVAIDRGEVSSILAGMLKPVPKVFISATSDDLSQARREAVSVLNIKGCLPLEQGHFAPQPDLLVEMLRKKIQQADAVVHIAGFRYGAEPPAPVGNGQRRSYTQMEYDLAEEMRKDIYLFLPDSEEVFGPCSAPPEDETRRGLQIKHREELTKGGKRFYTRIASMADFDKRIREIDWSRILPALIMFTMGQFVVLLAVLFMAAMVAAGGIAYAQYLVWKNDGRENADAVTKILSNSPTGNNTKAYFQAIESGAQDKNTDVRAFARSIDWFVREASKETSVSAETKQQVALLSGFKDANAEFALTGSIGRIEAAAAVQKLEEREQSRQSFAKGLAGPVKFLIGFVSRGLAPEGVYPTMANSQADDDGGDAFLNQKLREGVEDVFEQKGLNPPNSPSPSGAPSSQTTAESTTPKGSGIDLSPYILSPEEMSRRDHSGGRWLTAEHWRMAAKTSWEETWGLGPGPYRAGFLVGCFLIVLIIASEWSRRMRVWAVRPKVPSVAPAQSSEENA